MEKYIIRPVSYTHLDVYKRQNNNCNYNYKNYSDYHKRREKTRTAVQVGSINQSNERKRSVC